MQQTDRNEKTGDQKMEKAMQKYLDKAEVLIEALPYIQKFNRKVIYNVTIKFVAPVLLVVLLLQSFGIFTIG